MTSVKEILNREQYHLLNAKRVVLYGVLERAIYLLNQEDNQEIDYFIMKDNGSLVCKFNSGEWTITKHSIKENYLKNKLIGDIAELIEGNKLIFEHNIILSNTKISTETDNTILDNSLEIDFKIILSNGEINFEMENNTYQIDLSDIVDRLIS